MRAVFYIDLWQLLLFLIYICSISTPSSQIIGLFGFFRYIAFAMHLDIHNVYLERPKQPIIWNGGSRTVIISNYFFMISLLISFLCDKPKWLAYRRTIRAKISKV